MAFTRKLKTDRGVRDLELDLRLKGAVVPHLVSAVVVDFEGEACTVAIGQDITKIKESERALREAQERLSARVEEMTITQERLHAEIAERKAVEHIALERETTLRKIFQASPDLITIWRLSDGRYLEINREFSFTGYSRAEILGRRAKDLNVYVNPAQFAARDEKLRGSRVRCAGWRFSYATGTGASSTGSSPPQSCNSVARPCDFDYPRY